MNGALQRRLGKLEASLQWQTVEVPFPDIEVRFMTAETDPESYPQADSYPQGNDSPPVDKSEKPDMTIELEAGEDLNTVAQQLGISADELHRQIQRGQVCIVYPPGSSIPPSPASLAPKICWRIP